MNAVFTIRSGTFLCDISEFESLPEKKNGKKNAAGALNINDLDDVDRGRFHKLNMTKYDIANRFWFDDFQTKPPSADTLKSSRQFFYDWSRHLLQSTNLIWSVWSIWIMTHFHMIWSQSQNNANKFLCSTLNSCRMWNLFLVFVFSPCLTCLCCEENGLPRTE